MSQPPHALTDSEWSRLIALVGSNDLDGIRDFFKAMPTERSNAILLQLLTNMVGVVAHRSRVDALVIMDFLREVL
ncbi:hypothetical protein KSX_90380 [Ktedonospora formicarum]|uniref:Uncharacterized protein n=1 Tax=Ktedonospora formicarum TaxID=2778364 RepID=A0A8J3MWZ0_9CHLR|nr:hypothetical protein KSX_90380 [Ktedonospora formicarum]